MCSHSIENTFLFPSTEKARSIAEILSAEFINIKWDNFNGIDVYFIYEINELFNYKIADISDFFSIKIAKSTAFQRAIKQEKTEYCIKGSYCEKKIICPPCNLPKREFEPFTRETEQEDIKEIDEPINFMILDEIYFLFNESIPLEKILEIELQRYQNLWKHVNRRKKTFLDLKNEPNRSICLGAKGLELIDKSPLARVLNIVWTIQ